MSILLCSFRAPGSFSPEFVELLEQLTSQIVAGRWRYIGVRRLRIVISIVSKD